MLKKILKAASLATVVTVVALSLTNETKAANPAYSGWHDFFFDPGIDEFCTSPVAKCTWGGVNWSNAYPGYTAAFKGAGSGDFWLGVTSVCTDWLTDTQTNPGVWMLTSWANPVVDVCPGDLPYNIWGGIGVYAP